ncbi:MAG TPA: hypothetical protein VE136_18080 [Anaerolineales bacterium]|jgi:hypothetical protein|nr:hypothetical protein [Anaerolineales bacterium]
MSQTREQAVLYWWNMAEESLLAAKRESDAGDFVSFEQQYVDTQLTCCRQFLTRLRPLVSTLS